eukprot:gene6790-biopygen2369
MRLEPAPRHTHNCGTVLCAFASSSMSTGKSCAESELSPLSIHRSASTPPPNCTITPAASSSANGTRIPPRRPSAPGAQVAVGELSW